VQVERQLDADVVQPWIAESRKLQEEARAAAATIIERGRAQAGALKKLMDVYRTAGAAAREVLVLQQLMPMISAISGSGRKTKIREWTVLSDDTGSNDLARQAIRFNEKLRAATGVDIAKTVGRLGGGPPLPPPPPPKS